ncbi:nSTAND1 domain-containing NTPase [Aquiflexum lacus]|uniref:nSTAND1 domain-containing NTPase n=1 Tax=Aquiflexum lacus TaxID=2483805 RepID=UPI0018939F66|nr:ATP-binding protein [Aquiflexum lacus]
MFEDYQICPYTGLRSFTEEESLYFKGREDDIDAATAQLQRNKFLMLTGASGDGKSSLVYAGIIPNARAGFLKSKYTQWCVADFRPERSPFKNLCKAIANQLDIPNEVTVESELKHGFSAIVDLYRNSDRFLDEDTLEWQAADERKRASIKRKAANLIILVDQFEEFFTNPENYDKGVPSKEANLVLNLLLETSKIALEEGLPIYVIFTMRSDFIGQCAAFRGLPEYIGFSQFFVPRLNRAQLQLVIEEPAVLSGNQITRRLTERLIHDLTEGVDQLPILQHALNQIWHAASNGTEEMDLIHYAMVGGMSIKELPEDQVLSFKQWFDDLPENIKACYHAPSLQNVLDTHTNKLFEQAMAYYIENTGKDISNEDTKAIIKNAFSCLTKIDQSRAVRNRMTLLEITNILGRKEFGTIEVGAVLNIFREPGNTFIRPFISDDPESRDLGENDVLDITHESLIRNWDYLKNWAEEEYDNYTVYLDYEQQLNRWVESGKSNAFLMSIGPLTYFENWINNLNPNIHWVARYLPEELDQENKLSKAKNILKNSQEFLSKSASKHVITRTVMRYGAKRIGIAVALIAFLIFSSFAIRQYLKQQNSAVLNSIQAESIKLVNSPKVAFEDKIYLIVEQLKLDLTSIDEVINSVPDPIEKINIANGIATMLVFQGSNEPKGEILRSLTIADSISVEYAVPSNVNSSFSAILKELNDLRVTLELAYYHNPALQIDTWRKANAKRIGIMVLHILETQPADFTDMRNLTLALEHAINFRAFTQEEIVRIIQILSPFEQESQSDWLKLNFDADNLLLRGAADYGFKFNGLYQQLAYLYASQGNSERVLDCMDILLANSQNNYQGDYAAGADNAANIAAVYYKYRQDTALDEFVRGYISRKNITSEEFYASLLGRMLKSANTTFNLHLIGFMDDRQNLNLQFSDREQISYFYAKYRKTVLSDIKDPNERNYLLALSFKNEGILKAINLEERKNEDLSVNQLFDKAFEYYKLVPTSYLEQTTSVIGVGATDDIIVPRKFLFIYPDLRIGFPPLEPRSFFFFYFSDAFLEYVLENQLIDELYPTKAELDFFTAWLLAYNSKIWVPNGFIVKPARYEIFKRLETELSGRENIDQVDLNWLYLYLGEMAYKDNEVEAALSYYQKINPDNLLNILRSKEYGNQINNHSLRLIASAIEALANTGDFEGIKGLMRPFNKSINRSSLYAYAAKDILYKKTDPQIAKRLLDSAMMEFNRTGIVTSGQPHRIQLAYANTFYDPKGNVDESFRIIKNLQQKILANQFIVRSLGFHAYLYEAKSRFPENISDGDQAILLSEILYGYAEGKGELNDKWSKFQENYLWNITRWIFYIDESS